MDEIAPEYDVIVCGTGVCIASYFYGEDQH